MIERTLDVAEQNELRGAPAYMIPRWADEGTGVKTGGGMCFNVGTSGGGGGYVGVWLVSRLSRSNVIRAPVNQT